jgi:chemotaxis protein methyltransferase CheR
VPAPDDSQCVEFLQWALPRLGMRWPGFRKVRRQVCRRIRRRALELGLDGLVSYRGYLERRPDEWAVLDSLTPVTISRFCRDAGVFAFIQKEVLRALGPQAVNVWSAGCAGGEEPYTLAIISLHALAPRRALRILATDISETMLERARRGCFKPSSLRELPDGWRAAAFVEDGEVHRVSDRFREPVTFARHDIRGEPPPGPFDMVLCRNLAFTYFDADLQVRTVKRLASVLRPGGALVLGSHEALPPGTDQFEPWSESHRIYRRTRLPAR